MKANDTARAPVETSKEVSIPDRLRAATELLEAVAKDRSLLAKLSVEERTRLLTAAGEIYCPDVRERRRLVKAKVRQRQAEKLQRDQSKLNETGIRALRRKPVFTTPNVFPPENFEQREVEGDAEFREVVEPQNCYICKRDYSTIHHFYDQLCPPCAELNFRKRTELADLRGRVALLTGGRVKIGYQAGIKLLRAGAQLIVTTRFPRDSAARYAAEPDFDQWRDRLEIFGLDLRHTPSVEAFCRHLLTTRQRLDFIINNACQTVRRPPDFYQHMMEGETGSLHAMPEHARQLLGAYEGLRGYHMLPEGDAVLAQRRISEVAGLTHAAELSQVPLLANELAAQKDLFPEGRLDADLQQVDLRERNS
ncbi:MAG TPA: SDR family NAD(P)-dependent oxidoreductase, partial [Verrucomicrobiae bacterium]